MDLGDDPEREGQLLQVDLFLLLADGLVLFVFAWQPQQVVGGTGADFPPGLVVEVLVGGIGQVAEQLDIGEHVEDRLAGFPQQHVRLRIVLEKLGPGMQRQPVHLLDLRDGKGPELVQAAGVDLEVRRRGIAQQRAQLGAAVVVAALALHQLLAHRDQLLAFRKRLERRNHLVRLQLLQGFLDLLAFDQHGLRGFNRMLGGRHPEIRLDDLEDHILRGAAVLLHGELFAIRRLFGIHVGQTKIQGADEQFHLARVLAPFRTVA